MNNLKRFKGFLYIAVLGLFSMTACKTTSKSGQGAIIGSTAGGAIGGLIGKEKDKTAVGFIIGAAVGGTAGALIGRYMDKQADELERELEDADVERVGEGILITFDSGLLFDFDSYALRGETKQNLRNLASTLSEYGETNILIEGHTDSKGADTYNMKLSKQRSDAVADYLKIQGVGGNRLVIKGYGEEQPVATNDTDLGRQENRRVEVAIIANDELKREAKNGQLN
ncbi:MAG: OmpA family protein [Bacteroidota bacterium]